MVVATSKIPPIYLQQRAEACIPLWPDRGAFLVVELEPISKRSSLKRWRDHYYSLLEEPWKYILGFGDDSATDSSYQAATELVDEIQWARAVTELPEDVVAGALRRLLGIAPVRQGEVFLFSATELQLAGAALWAEHPSRYWFSALVADANRRLKEEQQVNRLFGDLRSELDG